MIDHTMSSQEYISSDIVFEILTRTTSLKTLDACKGVCTEWNNLIHEPSFLPTYCKRTSNLCGYFVQDIKQNKHISTFVSADDEQSSTSKVCIESLHGRDTRILASCNQGIVCCEVQSKSCNRYYVCKPATKQWQGLPNPKLRYQTAAVAIMVLGSSPFRYKVVRLSHPRGEDYRSVKGYYNYRCEIFDSTSWAWTRLVQGVNLISYGELILDSNPAISVSGSIHWTTSDDNVLVFDEPNATFLKFPLPLPTKKNNLCEYKQLLEYHGRLGLTCLNEGCMELWLRDETVEDDDKWVRKMVVDMESLEASLTYPYPVGFVNDEIATLKAFDEFVFYKLQDFTFSKVILDFDLRYAKEIFRFRSDLEPVDLGRAS